MSTSFRDYGVVAYFLVYVLLQMIPRFAYRHEQKFGQADILQGFPQFRSALQLLPRITSGLTVLMLLVVFGTWLSPTFAQRTTIHVIGIAYGTMLAFDAGFAWITGIRSIYGLRPRYVVLQGDTWRPMLQFSLALLFLAVPVWLLMR